MKRALFIASLLLVTLPLAPAQKEPDPAVFDTLSGEFENRIHPLLERYCLDCHDAATSEGELDLERFADLAAVRADPKTWQHIVYQLETGEMPPTQKKDVAQPSAAERAELIAWAKGYLATEARAQAGDPGPVILRRLSNAEYTYSVRDLTGVDTLDPAREFPVDGAAGEGFTNAGEALVMSPSLVEKYLAAAKEIAEHAVLLPDGIGFSEFTTRRDKTNELIARIKEIYRKYTVQGGGTPVNLQGIKFNTNEGGLLPLEQYLAASLGASRQGLSPRYLDLLERSLEETAGPPSPVLDPIRRQWRSSATNDAAALAARIGAWQKALWKFSPIGHIGRTGGPKSWLEPVTPIEASHEFVLKLPEPPQGNDLALHLAAGEAGDGSAGDLVLWKNARLRLAGQPDILLRDVASLQKRLAHYRAEVLAHTATSLAAAAEASANPEGNVLELARKHHLDPAVLQTWLRYLDIGVAGPVEVTGHFTAKMLKSGNGYDFIQGWGTHQTPSLGANSSDQQVRIPGIARPHSVYCHPSPTLFVAAGWQSPVSGEVRIEARLNDAHPECGNGVEWFLQHRTGRDSSTIWTGEIEVGKAAEMNPRTTWVNQGEVVALVIGPRAGSHACDLTAIDLTITETGGAKRRWDLAEDVSGNILAGNPHDDLQGNKAVWHFYQGEMKSLQREAGSGGGIPPGSLLAKWSEETDPTRRTALARRIQDLVTGQSTAPAGSPDQALLGQLRNLASANDLTPLLRGLEPDPRFGRQPDGTTPVALEDLAVAAPAVVSFQVPAELARGRELAVTGTVANQQGSVQMWVTTGPPPELTPELAVTPPVITAPDGPARRRLAKAFEEFRNLFPLTLCYERIVPVDEVVTLQLWHREDNHLRRLMLDQSEVAELDRLWDELYFVAREPREYLVAFNQICEFATQDRPDLVVAWAPHREPTEKRAAAFEQHLLDTEPRHLEALLEIADRAWRRPLSTSEKDKLRALYQSLRAGKIDHDPAIRLTLARVFTSPAFLYRPEEPGPDNKPARVSNLELATRLSYFFWSSLPDAELRRAAEAGELHDPGKLVSQAQRMLRDERARRLAIQFACQWLHIRNFDQHDEKNETLYPEFAELRGSMYEEAIRFFTDFFQHDRSILSLLDADHTFVDPTLAKFYNLPAPAAGWQRVENVKKAGRGGLLGFATTLAKQSGASRTSPILRGTWVSESLLGEKLPRPPKDVPDLPDELPAGLSERELIIRHSSDPACAKCHTRIDPYGFALESFDAIGRFRSGADTNARLPDGTSIEGIEGLRRYLLEDRRDTFVRHFCRKLLGYALGRAVQLSDEPFLDDLLNQLATNDYRIGVAVEAIVQSPQFRMIRGTEHGSP